MKWILRRVQMSKSKVILLGLLLFIILAATHNANARPMIRVAVIDTGYTEGGSDAKPCPGSDMPADIAQSKHGSNVAGIIAQGVQPSNDVCFLIYRIFRKEGSALKFDLFLYLNALNSAINDNATIVNLSVSGNGLVLAEALLIRRMLARNITIVAAAGNDSIDFSKTGCNVFPACADPRIIVVANSAGTTSNLGPQIDAFENGGQRSANGVVLSGTSQAAAAHTGRIIRRFLGME
jgi:hypothetical protein